MSNFMLNIMGVLLIGGGAQSLYSAYCFHKQYRMFKSNGSQTTGTVVALKEIPSSSEGDNTFAPVVRFIAPAGESIEFTSGRSSYPATYSVGQEVEVCFLPDNPLKAELASIATNFWGGLLFGVFGIALIGFGSSILFFSRWI